MRLDSLRTVVSGRLFVICAVLVALCALVTLVVSTRSRVPSEALAGPSVTARGSGGAVPQGGGSSGAPSSSAWTPPKWDTEENPAWKVGVSLRPMDHDIIAALQSGHVERSQVTDLFPDKPYQVRLAGSPATQQFRFVLIDLNRDGKWDERWDLGEPGQIKREVMHDPDALGHDTMYTLNQGKWQPH